jgi:soluble lytic murein transglycosylase-like protein
VDLSTNDARLALGAKYAAKYGLDTAIVCAVCEQESGWNPWAVRFEPAFYTRYIEPLNLPDPTEAYARSFSFGLMQVMGQVARELGFAGRSLTQLCDPDIGMDVGCRKLKKCFTQWTQPEVALLCYNGGGNADYGKQVLARAPNYQPAQGAG